MLGIGGSKPVAGTAEDVVECPISKAYDFIGLGFFENYTKWCPQVVELEQLSPPPVQKGAKGRQVTRDRGIDSESTFEVVEFMPTESFEIAGLSEPFRSSYALRSEANGATHIAFTFEIKEIDLVDASLPEAHQDRAAGRRDSDGREYQAASGRRRPRRPAKSAPIASTSPLPKGRQKCSSFKKTMASFRMC